MNSFAGAEPEHYQFCNEVERNRMTANPTTLNAKLEFVGLLPVAIIPLNPTIVFADADDRNTTSTEDEDVVEYFRTERYLGSAVFRKDGTLKSISPFCGGRPHGSWQEFSPTGQIISHIQYIDGEKSGLLLRWHDNGVLALAGDCNGRSDKSTTATWNSDGELVSWRIEEPGGESTAFICIACRHATSWQGWDHAGFSERGFLYNEDGDFVISWDARDPKYIELVGDFAFPWMLNEDQKSRIEKQLLPAPTGGNFLFRNPSRCSACRHPLSPPLPDCFYLWDPKRMIRSGVGESYPDGPFENYLR